MAWILFENEQKDIGSKNELRGKGCLADSAPLICQKASAKTRQNPKPIAVGHRVALKISQTAETENKKILFFLFFCATEGNKNAHSTTPQSKGIRKHKTGNNFEGYGLFSTSAQKILLSGDEDKKFNAAWKRNVNFVF